MDTQEKHIRDNANEARREARMENNHLTPDQIADSLPAGGKNRKNGNTRKTNRLWLWLGIIVLIFILIYWLFTIGMFDALTGAANG